MKLEEMLKGSDYISARASTSVNDGSTLLFLSTQDGDMEKTMEFRVSGDSLEVISSNTTKQDGESELKSTEVGI